MKRSIPLLFLSLAGWMLLGGCASAPVQQKCPPIVGLRNPSVRFLVDNTRKLPASGSFEWGFAAFRVSGLQLDLSAVDRLIHESLMKALTSKGFVKVDTNAELRVSYAVASGAGIDEATLNGAYEGSVQSPPISSGNPQHPLQYRRGTLIIDIVETKTKHLLWRGAIMADIDLNLAEDQKRLRCEGAVNILLKHYPKP